MRNRLPRTTFITVGLAAFLTGLGLARLRPSLVWLVLFVLCGLLGCLQKRTAAAGLVALGLVLGCWRGGVFLQKLEPYESVAGKQIVVRVTAEGDAVYGQNGQLSFDGGGIRMFEPFPEALPGRIKVQGYGETAVYRGDVVRISGRLYRTRGSRQASLSYAQLRVVGRSNTPIDWLRRRFAAGMGSALAEPHASFALGLLIGQRTTLPKKLTDELSAVGLTHIIAVSGYNLTIIVRATRRFGRKRSKYQVTLLSLVLIGGFLLVTGFSASIVRAALVSGLSLWAWYYGRSFRLPLLLMLVAALTAAWNPLYLWSDIGWYLSFLAFYGVLILVPVTVRRLYRLDKRPRALTLLVYETIGAQIMTVPLILYIFQEISLVALVSNVLVAPLVPFGMLLSFAGGLAGMVAPAFAGWVALPATVVLTYMLDTVELLARVPHALLSGTLPLAAMLALYIAIGGTSLALARKNATITDEKTEEL